MLISLFQPLFLAHGQAKASNWLKKGLFAVTAIVISWRFATSSIGRFAASLLDHKRRR
jgi:hypothetical protein